MVKSLATSTAFLILFATNIFGDDVTLTVEPKIQKDNRVVISGKTNLPPGTSLMISVEDGLTKETRGQTKTQVAAGGTFESQALGPPAGLKDGKYLASVTMPFARMQPEPVQQIIGDKAQNLTGPLVEKGFLGNTVNVEKAFVVGNKEGQSARLKDDLQRYKQLTAEIKESFALLESMKKKNLLDDKTNSANLREWGTFSRKLRSDHIALQERIEKIESLRARTYFHSAHGALGSMFHDAAFMKNAEYRKSKTDYLGSMKELQAFVRDREKLVSRKPQPARYREWSDTTGKYTVMARLISVSETSVTLEKENGKKVTVPLAKLSQKDRAHLKTQKR